MIRIYVKESLFIRIDVGTPFVGHTMVVHIHITVTSFNHYLLSIRHVDEIGAQEGSGKAEDRTRDILGLGGMEAPQVRNKEQVWDSAGLEVANRQEEIHPEKSALCFKKDKLEISNC